MKHKILLLSAFMALISACGAWAENTIIKKQLLLNEAEKTWGADFLTVNTRENSFTYNAGTNDDGSDACGNGAMGWTNVSDISSYTNLVLKLKEATTAGVDNQDNPTELYLQPVNGVLKAGVAYVFKTNSTKLNTEANNYMNGGGVFFTKAGANTLTAPEADGALVGTFTDETEVPDGMYILTDEGWKTNASGVTNKVNANRAYLDLSKVGEVPADVAAKCVTIGIEGKTTDIANLSTVAADSDAIYKMNGVRVSNPQKGIYIKNGKKFIVK